MENTISITNSSWILIQQIDFEQNFKKCSLNVSLDVHCSICMYVCVCACMSGSHIITKKLLLTATVKFYVLLKELGSSESEHIGVLKYISI